MNDATIILFLARHGATSLNQNNSFRGNKNVPLAPEGIRDANRLAAYFKDQPLSFIVSSDKIRATQTANIIKSGHDVKVYDTPTLRALDVGDFSGQKRTPENILELQKYLDDPDSKIPGGESLNGFKGRIRPALWEAFEIADDAGEPGLIVAHSSVIHEVGAWLHGSHEAVLVEPGGVVAVYVHKGTMAAQAIHKPVPITSQEANKADTIS